MTDTQPCACPCCQKPPTVELRTLFDEPDPLNPHRTLPPQKRWAVHCCACPGHGIRRPAEDRETAVAEWNLTYGEGA